MKPINRDIFRTYDIRGLVDKDFDEEWVENLGRAAGTYFLKQDWDRAVIGYDCRHTSPAYHDALARGLTSTGVDVLSVGMVPTPLLYFAITHLNFSAGIMVTASHNPPEFNGFKVWGGESTLYGEQIQDIWRIMDAGEFTAGKGLLSIHDIAPSYIENMLERVSIGRRLKVVVDGGNGSGGPVTAELLRRAGAEVVEIYCEPDGSFPNHHPDPTIPKYMKDLEAKVVEEKADFGIGLDGDGDRIGVVTEKGELLFGDQLLAIFARQVLAEEPGATILGDVKCSHLAFRDIEEHGGKAVMTVTGHSLVKKAIKDKNAALAGELSGHMFFKNRFFGYDDATYAALRMLEIASRTETPVSRYLENWPRTYNTPEIHVPCPEHAKKAVIAQAQEHFRRDYKITDIDGARILFPDGWGLVRASNTQPVLVLRFEAESGERLEEIRKIVEEPVKQWVAERS